MLNSSPLCFSLLGLLALSACSGAPEPSEPSTPSVPQVELSLPAQSVSASWMVQVAAPGAQDAVMAQGPWKQIFERDYAAVLAASEGDLRARFHAESSAIYRQAALLQAQAIVQTFSAEQIRDTDPAQVQYFLGVAQAILGQDQAAKESFAKEGGDTHSEWAQVLEQGLSAQSLPALYPIAQVTPGQAPDLPSQAIYEINERVGDSKMELADPSATLQLALWHEAAARASSDGGGAIADALIAPWRLPFEEQAPVTSVELELQTLFLSSWTSGADIAFVSALASSGSSPGSPEPLQVLESFVQTSILAAALSPCVEAAVLDTQCVVDSAAELNTPLVSAMSESAGAAAVDHRMYAKMAQATVLRAGARLALAMGDERGAALLRINALDRSVDAAADPTFLLSQAAWDAGTRNALRAQELLHTQTHVLPGMDTVRVSLDALHLRVSRDAGPAMPMH